MDTEKNKILSNLKGEFESFGENYAPNKRQAAEMYAQYQPSEFSGFSKEGQSEYGISPNGKSEKIAGSSDQKRLEIQNMFLDSIANGDRKNAIKIAIDSERKNIGIPLNYFNDILDRDRLMRLAYEQDNSGISQAAIGPSSYNAIPEATPTKMGPLQAGSSEVRGGTKLTPENLDIVMAKAKYQK
jgi:hypothetical protein